MNSLTEYGPELTVIGVIGFLVPFLAAIVNQLQWSSTVRRWVAIVLSILAAVIALLAVGAFTDIQFQSPQQIIGVVLGVIGVSQVVFAALRPLLSKIEVATATEQSLQQAKRPQVDVIVDGSVISSVRSEVPLSTTQEPDVSEDHHPMLNEPGGPTVQGYDPDRVDGPDHRKDG